MALFRKLLYRKPPDGLLEICERVYVFDCCFTTDALQEENYKDYICGVAGTLKEHFPEASFLVFNFQEGEAQSQIAEVLSEYDMTIIEYPRQYEGCPLLTLEMIHHFLRSGESWLSLGQQNLLLMHCEHGGWPVLAFMLAALLIYRKQYSGEQKTLDMIYRQAPRELLHLLSSLNPVPSQLRYLQYVSRRNVASEWPPLDRALTLDCVILRFIPDFNGEGGCRPVFRVFGQDPFHVSDRRAKILYSTRKTAKTIRAYKQAECELVKIDINCHIQGDVVLECASLNDDMQHEEMMFRAVFNTAFIRSNILMLNRDEIDMLWDAKDCFPKYFRVEILFSEMDAAASVVPVDFSGLEDKEGLPVEAFAKVHEIFSSVDWLDPKTDAALNVLQQISVSTSVHEKSEKMLRQGTEQSSPRQEKKHNKPQEIKEHSISVVSFLSTVQKVEYAHSAFTSLQQDEHQGSADASYQSLAVSNEPAELKSVSVSVVPSTPSCPPPDQSTRTCTTTMVPPPPPPPPPPHPHHSASEPVEHSIKWSSAGSQMDPKTLSTLQPIPSAAPRPHPPPPPPPPPRSSSPPSMPTLKGTSTIKVEPPTPPPPPTPPLKGTSTVEVGPPTTPPSTMPPLKGTSILEVGPPTPPPPPMPPSKGTSTLEVGPPTPPPPPMPLLKGTSTLKVGPPTPPHPPMPPLNGTSTLNVGPPTPPPPPTPPLRDNAVVRARPPPPPPSPLHSGPAKSLILSSPGTPPPPPPPPTLPSNSSVVSSASPPPIATVPPPPVPSGNGILRSSSGDKRFSGPPPTPAPPSSSPLSTKGRLSRTISSRSNQTKRLKPLHWLKLTKAMQGSLWAEAQKSGEASKAPEIDMSELESLFSAAVSNSDPGGKSSIRGSRGPKAEKVQLIDHRRAYNCEIMLSKVKVPLHALMSSVLALEDSALDVDQVENLIKFCPTKEEMELLKGYTGDKEKLGKCEEFFLELMKVPRAEAKLRVFSFKMQFNSQVSDLRNSLNIVNNVAEEIRNSKKLKRIMQTILSLGNALNQGTARGSAVGFRLDSLLKLTDTRARNNKMTLMHYLCKVLADQLPELLDFSKDLASLEPSSKIQLKFLAEEMQAISKGLEKVVQELASSENDGPISENFCKILKQFLCSAEAEVRSLASLYSGVGKNVDALILYFGEDPAVCPFEQVVSTLLNFVRLFNKAHEENRKQLETEMKKSAENDKPKIISPHKGSTRILSVQVQSGGVR